MRATLWFALQSLGARRSRSILLAVAVALASTLVVAVGCGLESARANVVQQIGRYIGRTDARLVNRFGVPFDAAQAEKVRALPRVDAVATVLGGSLSLVRADGVPGEDGRPRRVVALARGLDSGGDERFRTQDVTAGRLPLKAGEVAIDPLTAKALGAKIGDRLQVQRFGDPIELEVVGTLDRPSLGALQRPFVTVDRATVVEAGGTDAVTSVLVALVPGTEVAAWIEAHKGEFPEPLSLEPSERYTTGFDRQERTMRLGFVLVSMIAFVSCAFIVGTGMTTAVAEQQRELAIARCVGASRAQVFLSQVWAGTILCGLAGLAGVPLGMLAARALAWWFSDILKDGFFVSWFGIALGVAGSLAAGVGGSVWAAWQASRTTPLAALAPHARPPRLRPIAWLGVLGVIALLGQVALLAVPDVQARFWTYTIVGVPLAHAGWFALAVPATWLLGQALAPALERLLRLPRGLLRGALRQAPYRGGFTAGALMVGVSVFVSSWTNGSVLMRDMAERVRISDGFVFKTNGMTVQEQARVRALPGVQSAVPIGYLPLKVVGEELLGIAGLSPTNVVCVGFPPDQFLALNRLDWIEGSPESALPKLRSGEGVLVAKEFLVARKKRTGDHIKLGGGRTVKEYEIVGVVGAAGLDVATQFFGIRSVYLESAVSCVFMDFEEVARSFGSRDAYILQIDMDDAASPEADAALGESVTDTVPGAVFASGRAIRRTVLDIGATVLAVSSAIAFTALLLACFGVGNVVAANIAARRFQYGVLRATGAEPGMLVRLVAGEIAIIALAGAVVGTALGLHLARAGAIWYRDLGGLEVAFDFPIAPIAACWGILVAMTLGAAMPAVLSLARRPVRELLA